MASDGMSREDAGELAGEMEDFLDVAYATRRRADEACMSEGMRRVAGMWRWDAPEDDWGESRRPFGASDWWSTVLVAVKPVMVFDGDGGER